MSLTLDIGTRELFRDTVQALMTDKFISMKMACNLPANVFDTRNWAGCIPHLRFSALGTNLALSIFTDGTWFLYSECEPNLFEGVDRWHPTAQRHATPYEMIKGYYETRVVELSELKDELNDKI